MVAKVSSAAVATSALASTSTAKGIPFIYVKTGNSTVLYNVVLFFQKIHRIEYTFYQCDNLLKFSNPYAVHVQDYNPHVLK